MGNEIAALHTGQPGRAAPARKTSPWTDRARSWLGSTGAGWWDAATVLVSMTMIAMLWIMTVERARHEKLDALESASRETSNLAIALEEHTIRTFKGIEQALALVAYEYRAQGRNADITQM